jgi:hypothetical protein
MAEGPFPLLWYGGGAAGGGSADGSAVLAVVVELGDRFRVVPLSLARQIFGGYQVTGLSDLGEKISDAIGVLVSPNRGWGI